LSRQSRGGILPLLDTIPQRGIASNSQTMDEAAPPPNPAKPSQIPSWVMLGFVLGAAFVLALPGRRGPPAREAAPPASPPAVKYVVAPHLTTVEAVFAEWGKYAVWDNDVTEVALWNADSKDFTDFYEVVRLGDSTYFRSIPHLTRPVLTHGVIAGSPLEFTETDAQREEWLRARDDETWRTLSGSTGKTH